MSSIKEITKLNNFIEDMQSKLA